MDIFHFLAVPVKNNADGIFALGTVDFYLPGTTGESNRKAVYLDADGVTQAANPYTLDANGTAILYGTGQYHVVIKDSVGTTKFDFDYVDPANLGDVVAQHWAIYPEDQLVPEGNLVDEYSAYHWAQKAIAAAATVGGIDDVQVFTTSGTWTKPASTTKFEVIVVGGGGAGGGVTTGAADRAGGGGGAGGGAYIFLTSGVGATETVTIGAGGTGASAAVGGNGSASSFGTLCVAAGGSGGGKDSGTFGGAGSGTTGDHIFAGGSGLWGHVQTINSTAIVAGGAGGRSPFGIGAGGQIAYSSGAASVVGNAGTYGGGGSGAAISGSGAASRAGGNGGAGIVIVKSYK